ncbi:MAG: hypothetical protein KF799_03695 [Bdellovibrionales bacterium]|nr:hypothetical protein [Bdellovibrionales bacterium]
MQRWIWFLVAALVSTGVYFTIRYGLRPKPIPVMNPTQFTDLEQIGVVIYKRLRHDIRAERLVVLGTTSDMPQDSKLWTGFFKAAAADKEKIVFFPRKDIAQVPEIENLEIIPFDEASVQNGQFFKLIQERMKAGQLIIVHGLTNEVSHLINGSLSRQLDRVVQHPVLSISSLRFALKQEDRDSLQTLCLDTNPTGENKLACAGQKVARKYLRKNLDAAKIWAVMERHGLKEYLVFVNTP